MTPRKPSVKTDVSGRGERLAAINHEGTIPDDFDASSLFLGPRKDEPAWDRSGWYDVDHEVG